MQWWEIHMRYNIIHWYINNITIWAFDSFPVHVHWAIFVNWELQNFCSCLFLQNSHCICYCMYLVFLVSFLLTGKKFLTFSIFKHFLANLKYTLEKLFFCHNRCKLQRMTSSKLLKITRQLFISNFSNTHFRKLFMYLSTSKN